jgi:SAM-dependent methyltransferase
VLNIQFSDLNFHEVFDGVWACASLLHCTADELNEIIEKIIDCIKPDGIFYLSFKYGDFSGIRDGRYYNDFTTKRIKKFLSGYKELDLMEIWKNPDVRDGRESELWLNVLLKKLFTMNRYRIKEIY